MFGKKIKSLGLAVATICTVMGTSAADVQSTQDVWIHHIQAWQNRSVKEIIADYSDVSVLVLNNKIFKGQKQIENVFKQLFKIFDNGSNRIDSPVLFDRFVYITWHFTPKNKRESFGTDTFVIENEKIILQTIASPLYESYPVSRQTEFN